MVLLSTNRILSRASSLSINGAAILINKFQLQIELINELFFGIQITISWATSFD